ncbi:MAG: hypothetical protein EBZ87_00715 [Microbacteriaceae bacterium]|nr:hypothetical protein [Microbacteriaceae bacterium]
MAHFAELDENNKVIRIVVVKNEILLDENGSEKEELGQKFLEEIFGGRWIQTSYNAKFRGIFAGEGAFYDEVEDKFK